ncbi:hypothetical protein WG922_21225 [Ramlibacter sp. AN1015]|uniref:hypothetical protein n=1 Tax=Ramlibacter sp. AN1015 TaxID=3133428 RepID=UPI0030BDFAA0
MAPPVLAVLDCVLSGSERSLVSLGDVNLTHCAEVTYLGNDGGLFAIDVDRGASTLKREPVLALGSGLPEKVNSHRDIGGAANAQMNRGLYVALVAVVPPLLWWLLGFAARRGKLSVPNAAY